MNIEPVKFKGRSMEGLIKSDDVVNVGFFTAPRSLLPTDEGSIVLLKNQNEWIIHRVVRTNGTLTTKGDQNMYFDSLQNLPVWGKVVAVKTKKGLLSWPFQNRKAIWLLTLFSKLFQSKTPRPIRGIIRRVNFVFTSFIRATTSLKGPSDES